MKKLLIILLFIAATFIGSAQNPLFWDQFEGVKVTGLIYQGDTILITEPVNGELLVYQGGKWVNASVLDTLVYYTKKTDLSDSLALRVPYTGATGNVILGTFGIEGSYLKLLELGDLVPTTGTLYWNTDEKTVSVQLEDGGAYEVGQELGDFYTNLSGGKLYEGNVVSIVPTPGNRMAVTRTDATDTHLALCAIGVVTVDKINNNQPGRITKFGKVRPINTNAWNEGDILYVNPAAPGELTNVRPLPPNYVIKVGTVVVKHATEGVIDVRIVVLPKLEDLSDVDGTPLTVSGQIPVYDQEAGYFDFTENIHDYTLFEDLIDTLQYYPTSTVLADSLTKYAKLSGATFTGNISAANLSGTNTGDQDLTDPATQLEAVTGAKETVYIAPSTMLNTFKLLGVPYYGAKDNLYMPDYNINANNIEAAGYLRAGSSTVTASAANVGAIRYREDATNSYIDVVMRTGANTYEWVNIVNYNW
jgi:hypothetical protein